MSFPAPSEATGFPTTAAWWSSEAASPSAMLRLVAASQGALGMAPGEALRAVAGLFVAGFSSAVAEAESTGDNVAHSLGRAFHALKAYSGGGDPGRDELAPHVAQLDGILAANRASESGGPAWAPAARAVRCALLAIYRLANAPGYVEAAARECPGLTASLVRGSFPRPPSNVADPILPS